MKILKSNEHWRATKVKPPGTRGSLEKKRRRERKCRAGPPPSSLSRCGETEISTFNSRLMCAARPGPLFFTLFPLLTRGGIINPTLKTACRDRARFRRDFRPLKIPTRLHFSIHIHFSLYFLVWLYPASSLPPPSLPPSASIVPSFFSSLTFPAQSLYERKINYTQYVLICSPRNAGCWVRLCYSTFRRTCTNGHGIPLFEENQLASSFYHRDNQTEY